MSQHAEGGSIARPSRAIRAIAFDLDGLMLDTETLFFRIASDMLSERGKRFTGAMMTAMMGRRAVEGLAEMKRMAGLEDSLDAIRDELKERFVALERDAVKQRPGLIALLDYVRGQGVPHAVATSSGIEYATRLLDEQGILARFEFLMTAEDVSVGKPDPEIYLKTAARFGIDPGEMLVLEDSPPGVSAGVAAGSFVVAVPHEFSPGDGLAHAHRIAPRLDDPLIVGLI